MRNYGKGKDKYVVWIKDVGLCLYEGIMLRRQDDYGSPELERESLESQVLVLVTE